MVHIVFLHNPLASKHIVSRYLDPQKTYLRYQTSAGIWKVLCNLHLEPQSTIYKWMFGEFQPFVA